MPGDEAHRFRAIPVRQRHAKRGGERQSGGDARYHVVGDAGGVQFGDLLARAAEDHRIAGFQPHDMAAGAGELHHQCVDLVLLAAWAAGALADQDAPGFATGEFEHVVGDEVVEQDHVGGLQGADGLERQKLGVARPGSDEGHPARFRVAACPAQHLRQICLGCVRRRGSEGAVDETLPEGTPGRAGRERLDHTFADRAGKGRPVGEGRRQ